MNLSIYHVGDRNRKRSHACHYGSLIREIDRCFLWKRQEALHVLDLRKRQRRLRQQEQTLDDLPVL